MRNAAFDIHPLAGAVGAELLGIDISGALSDETVNDVRQALLDHGVIFFRDQTLPPEQFLALAKRFGTPIEYPFVKGLDGFPEIIAVAKLEHEKVNFGGVWHSDTTYLERPPMGTLLVAREVPDVGGDTMFANQYLAYDRLSAGMKRLLDGLTAVSSSAKADVYAHARGPDEERRHARPRARRSAAEHPVVRTHPETGRRALYVNTAHTAHLRRHDRGGKRAAAGLPVPPSDPAGIHLPLPLAARARSRSGTIAASSTTR